MFNDVMKLIDAGFTKDEIIEFAEYLPVAKKGTLLVDILVNNGLATVCAL